MSYSPKDLLSYWILLALAYALLTHSPLPRGLSAAVMLYLGIFQGIKKGFHFDFIHTAKLAAELPVLLTRRFALYKYVFGVAVFAALAVAASTYGQSIIASDTIAACQFCSSLAVPTAIRTVSLFSHLKSQAHVKAVLLRTQWAKEIKQGVPFPAYILEAYLVGFATSCLQLLPMYFYRKFLNQTLALFGVELVQIACRREYRSLISHLHSYNQHKLDHTPPGFVYIHGTHHNVLPCAINSCNEAGLLEAFLNELCMSRTYSFPPLMVYENTALIVKNMLVHAHIPGVFPYSQYVFRNNNRHIEHHMFNLRPLATGRLYRISDNDIVIGDQIPGMENESTVRYKPDNEVWRAFASSTEKFEEALMNRNYTFSTAEILALSIAEVITLVGGRRSKQSVNEVSERSGLLLDNGLLNH